MLKVSLSIEGVSIIKEFTVEINTYCENGCSYCSTDASDEGSKSNWSLQELRDLFQGKTSEGYKVVNISGGEPLAHPDIYKILKEAYSYFDKVWVYTNMVRNIRFNSDIVTEGITTHANCVIKEGQINIPKADKVHLLELQKHGRAKDMDKINYSVSGEGCDSCDHKVYQADGKITKPCNKDY